jgi:hypothetical protein
MKTFNSHTMVYVSLSYLRHSSTQKQDKISILTAASVLFLEQIVLSER